MRHGLVAAREFFFKASHKTGVGSAAARPYFPRILHGRQRRQNPFHPELQATRTGLHRADERCQTHVAQRCRTGDRSWDTAWRHEFEARVARCGRTDAYRHRKPFCIDNAQMRWQAGGLHFASSTAPFVHGPRWYSRWFSARRWFGCRGFDALRASHSSGGPSRSAELGHQ